jgi:hypothetical protein
VPRFSSTFSVSEDGQSVSLIIEVEGGTSQEYRMDALDVERHVDALEKGRRMITPAVPNEFPEGGRYEVIRDPAWRVGLDVDGQAVLRIRHPGLGWLNFIIPRDGARNECANLAKALDVAANSTLRAAPEGSGKLN